jgi:hypothetical protein
MKCATCHGPVPKADPLPKHFPFCCERCQLIDLGRWLGEEYRIAQDPAYAASAAGPDDDA